MKQEISVVKEINSPEAKQLLQKDTTIRILDVRTPEEYNMGHVENAVNIDISNPAFTRKILELDRNKTYLVYCRTHHRSAIAVDFMLNNQFKNVYQMLDGFSGWRANNLPEKK